MPEVIVLGQGTWSLVQASGEGRAWATAATPPSARDVAFIEAATINSAMDLVTIRNVGTPHHHKNGGRQPIEITMTTLYTGGFPSALTSSGASMPMYHGEWKDTQPELGGGTARYFQFMGMAMPTVRVTPGLDGNRLELTWRALAMVGPTGSGYLS